MKKIHYQFIKFSPLANFSRGLLALAFFLLAVVSSQDAMANAAQPGVWNAGGTVFTMLFPDDSLTFKKVQMKEERIYIQLYKGYAVVKGIYLFRNTTKETLNFKMGYPINGIYSGGDVVLNQVQIDQLNQFKIKANEHWLPLVEQQNGEYGNINSFGDNWKVWQMDFLPYESKTVQVYFIVNTNDGTVSRGYNKEHKNAFIYLLESGSVWKYPIEKGSFYIQLMDGLTAENVQGISQGFGFKFNSVERIFAGAKIDFSPTPKDNLVVTYCEHEENFAFEKIVAQADELFAKVDEMSTSSLETLNYTEVQTGDPYEVDNTFSGYLPSLLILFVIYAPFVIGFILLVIIIWVIVRWLRNRRRKNNGI